MDDIILLYPLLFFFHLLGLNRKCFVMKNKVVLEFDLLTLNIKFPHFLFLVIMQLLLIFIDFLLLNLTKTNYTVPL